MARTSVEDTAEFRRVLSLPRRVLSLDDANAWADVLTEHLAVPGSGAKLRPWQAMFMAEALVNHGAWGALPVGLGKTLISYLAPIVLGCERSILVIPATLREKTWGDFRSFQGKWLAQPNILRVVSRDELQSASGAHLLDQARPQCIIVDEADEQANPQRGSPARITRYKHKHPDTIVLCFSGTPGRLSIMNYWHQLLWCLKDPPVPRTRAEAKMWAQALDECIRSEANRVNPGVLGDDLREARWWYFDRLHQTPGVVIVDEDSCDAPLTIRTRLALEDQVLDQHYARFLNDFETPGGEFVSDPLSRWMLDGQLGCGVYRYWDPPPPEAWRNARRELCAFVRDQCRNSQRSLEPLDTEAQVCAKYKHHPTVQTWRETRLTFRGQTKARWVSTSVIQSVRAWLAESPEPGIVWCGSVDFAEALARATRLQYYGRKGESQGGVQLFQAPTDQSLIASWHANKRGFNLQAWGRALIVMPPQSAKWLEQIFGRMHRSGREDDVVIDILLTSGGTIDAFEAAIREAEFCKATLGLTQKILRANIVRAKPRITESNKYRWATRTQKEGN